MHALHQKYGPLAQSALSEAGRHADSLSGPVFRVAPGTVNLTNIEAMKTVYGSRETFRKSQFHRLLGPLGQQGLFNTTDVELRRRHR